MVSVGVVLDYISCEVLLSFRIASLHPSSLLATVKRPIFSLVTQPVLLKGKNDTSVAEIPVICHFAFIWLFKGLVL